MMKRNSGMGRKATASESSGMDEVEQLLQAAQDDVLLKLSLNSHISRGSSHSLDPDLSSRFQALKTRPFAPKLSPPRPSHPHPQVDDELKAVLGDDLSARFAALRGSANPSSSSSPFVASSLSQALPGPPISPGLCDLGCSGSNPGNEEDEVDKIIQWAKDAARLDPSPPSDEDDDNDDTGTGSSSDDERGDIYDKPKGAKKGPRPRGNP